MGEATRGRALALALAVSLALPDQSGREWEGRDLGG
jgi:hypothetical protein